MGINHRICDFPNFSVRCNNYKDCSISGVFSALGAPRKVVDTIFESSYSLGTIVQYAISQIFQHGWIIPVEWHFIAREIPGGVWELVAQSIKAQGCGCCKYFQSTDLKPHHHHKKLYHQWSQKYTLQQFAPMKNVHTFACTQHCSLSACIDKTARMKSVARII